MRSFYHGIMVETADGAKRDEGSKSGHIISGGRGQRRLRVTSQAACLMGAKG